MSSPEYKRTHETENSRVRWVHDEDYQTTGSYGFETEDLNKAAEADEIADIEAGNLVVLGAIVETRCEHCEAWSQTDSLWGIVVSVDEDLTKYGDWALDIPGVKP